MTVKEASQFINKELKPIYPGPEIESFTYLILNHLLGIKRFDIYLKPDEVVANHHEFQIYNIIEQLKHYKPVQYILGTTEFYGMPFYVDESVLIPRPETEELVQWVLSDYHNTSPWIIDIGTGSGCIAISLARNLPSARIVGADISGSAIETAGKNALLNHVVVEFIKMDILAMDFPDMEHFDVIVSNPPYITIEQKNKMEANVLDFEPHLALFVPNNDPLVFYKAIGNFAVKNLNKNGSLYVEINEAFPDETKAVFEEAGFSTELKKDINNKHRMLKARFYDNK